MMLSEKRVREAVQNSAPKDAALSETLNTRRLPNAKTRFIPPRLHKIWAVPKANVYADY